MTRGSLIDRVDAVAVRAITVTAGHELESRAREIRSRLHRPLRVAIAGRAKAGKSTLLNALVGERLAATDATECTKIVTWYQADIGYSVSAVLRTGERLPIEFDRDDRLEIRLGRHQQADVARLEVGWPSSRLNEMTLIDTPGLDGPSADASARTAAALLPDDAEDGGRSPAGDADAVLYLVRHLHQRDAAFLEAFTAEPHAAPSPINAVALLSRADELGAGRSDALDSAAGIARRYAADPRLRPLASDVLPIAGLLAETGASLREGEVAALRVIAALQPAMRDALLLSVDRFRGADNPLDPEAREHLLRRFGLFGLRLCIQTLVERHDLTAVALSQLLVDASGVRRLEHVLARSFAARADALKARSALEHLRALTRPLVAASLPGSTELAAQVEWTAAAAHELAELRLLQQLRAGDVALRDDEVAEVERLLEPASPPVRLGRPQDASMTELARVSLAGIERWRTRLGHPLLDHATRDAAEIVARTYEGIYQDLARPAG